MTSWNIPASRLAKLAGPSVVFFILLVCLFFPPSVRADVQCPSSSPNCCAGAGSLCEQFQGYSGISSPEDSYCQKVQPSSTVIFPANSPPSSAAHACGTSSSCASIFLRENPNAATDGIELQFAAACYPYVGGDCSYPQRCGLNNSGTQMCRGEWGRSTGQTTCEAESCSPCAMCGNGACETGEGADTCADCREATVTEVCNDGFCSPNEYRHNSCPNDCRQIQEEGECRYEQGNNGRECPIGAWQTCTGRPDANGICRYNTSTTPNCSQCSTPGDNRCSPGERSVSSPDCNNPLPAVCGNNICEEGEELQCRDCTRFAGLDVGDSSGRGSGISCSWNVPNENGFELCFSSNDRNNLTDGNVRFYCRNSPNINACGGALLQLIYNLNPVTISVGNEVEYNLGQSSEQLGQEGNRHYACWHGSFNQDQIRTVAVANIQRRCAQQITFDVAAFLVISRIAPIGGTIGRLANVARTVALVNTAFSAAGPLSSLSQGDAPSCLTEAISDYFIYEAVFEKGDNLSCRTNLQFQYSSPTLPDPLDPEEDPAEAAQVVAEVPEGKKLEKFSYCKQVPGGPQQTACEACVGAGEGGEPKDNIYTAVGCIRTGKSGLAGDFIRLGLGVGGGLALVSILAGAFMFSTSQGDATKLKEAKGLITASVAGLLFMIFSVIILNFVGVEIFRIPGLR